MRQAKLGVSCRVKVSAPSTRSNQPFVPSVAMMNENAKTDLSRYRRRENLGVEKWGDSELNEPEYPEKASGPKGTQISVVSVRTTSLKRTQGTT